jgi:uncharacterized protein YqeY
MVVIATMPIKQLEVKIIKRNQDFLKRNKMRIKEKINEDFLTAYKNKDMFVKNLLSVIKGEVSRGEAGIRTFVDADMIKLLKRMVESAEQINSEESLKEKDILIKYLPANLTEEVLTEKIIEIIKSLPVEDKANIGKSTGFVIKTLTGNYPNMFDSKLAANLVRENLK